MARVNANILAISELKWTGMGEFNSDEHYIYYCGQESLRRNGVALRVNKRVWMQYLGKSQKQKNDLYSFLRQAIQYHSNPSLYTNQQCWRSWSWTVLWGPTSPFRTNTQKRCPFHYRGPECKSRKSRNTWSNRQIWPWNTEWSRAKTNRVLPREHTGHSKPSSNNTREDSTHGHHQMVNTEIKLTIFFAAKDGEALYSQQKQDQELTVAQIMNSLLPNSDLNWRK